MRKTRAEFPANIKRSLSERAGMRCSFPGCGRLTIGPSLDDIAKSVNLGKAAHIYAASNLGPRANPLMNETDLSNIENGIWLCAHHSEIIDRDPDTYTADTLKSWKKIAEAEAYRLLRDLQQETAVGNLTLIALTSELIFYGIWRGASDNGDRWDFEVVKFVQGDAAKMQALQMNLSSVVLWEKYLAIESQGCGRPLLKFSWQSGRENRYELQCFLGAELRKHNPDHFGSDFAWNTNTREIEFENGDFKLVSGVDTAIQNLEIILGSRPGDFADYSPIGSHFSAYCSEYKDDLPLLNKLIKIEIIRLMEIKYGEDADRSQFNFIHRVLNVQVIELNFDSHLARIRLELELGNFQHWSGNVAVGLRDEYPPVSWDGPDDWIGEDAI